MQKTFDLKIVFPTLNFIATPIYEFFIIHPLLIKNQREKKRTVSIFRGVILWLNHGHLNSWPFRYIYIYMSHLGGSDQPVTERSSRTTFLAIQADERWEVSGRAERS